jgi:protein SCO1/2
MKRLLLVAAFACVMTFPRARGADQTQGHDAISTSKSFQVNGVVRESHSQTREMVIQHDSVPGLMPAMTMRFKVKGPFPDAPPGSVISFRLNLTQTESWIDQVRKHEEIGQSLPIPVQDVVHTNAPPVFNLSQIPDLALTNELGARVSLREFQGQAVALTFFFTRCPIPEYCPRLSRNFAEVSRKLLEMKQGPTNWHLLSISFDPLDTPEVLRAYSRLYRSDTNHWTFLTGAPDDIRSLTHGFGVSTTPGGGVIAHDFRTAIFDGSGRLQTLWPFGGNQTDMLVQELIKAAALNKRQNQVR